MEGSPIVRRWRRPRKSIGETIKKDLGVNSLSLDMIYEHIMASFDSYNRLHLVGKDLVVVGVVDV